MEEKALAGDFTQGSIANKLIRFMIPILGALVLQAMYGAVDLLVVGQFGTDAGISAVSTGSNVINLVTFVISELTMGVTVLIGRYLGENRNERIGKVIGGAIVFFAIMAAVLMVLLLAFAPEAILTCLVFSYIGYFNGHGKTIPVMVQGISASFLVRVPLSYLFSIQKGATLTTIGYAVPLASVYGIIFFTICYLVFLRKMKK